MKILLFDDHRIFGESLSKLLEDWDEISICRYVSNETEFWNILSVDEWDIVLLDVNLREQSKSSGIDLIETIYSKKPKIKVVMLSSYDMPVYRQEALKKGAVSYIDKSASADELVKKLTAISKGHKSTTPPLLDPLTDREAEIIKAIGTGKTKHEIAQELYISERTLYNHIPQHRAELIQRIVADQIRLAVADGNIPLLVHFAEIAQLHGVTFFADRDGDRADRLVKTILFVIFYIVNDKRRRKVLELCKQLIYLFFVHGEGAILVIRPYLILRKRECPFLIRPRKRRDGIRRGG